MHSKDHDDGNAGNINGYCDVFTYWGTSVLECHFGGDIRGETCMGMLLRKCQSRPHRPWEHPSIPNRLRAPCDLAYWLGKQNFCLKRVPDSRGFRAFQRGVQVYELARCSWN